MPVLFSSFFFFEAEEVRFIEAYFESMRDLFDNPLLRKLGPHFLQHDSKRQMGTSLITDGDICRNEYYVSQRII
ncbi:hypothetical protein PITCH_A410012 [uncultured Desulfobacterium sp.]|uniref:Uncharacterized protein n=1 Tax=uncultured Desulfobacterium sp. TaxID=201089 RepID=A0A445N0A5_9BACT|nr:hypothetical protein PITCH_A410012 [uncultured Desulfobacterium sp.]